MRNIVLITLDSVRADHCSFMGYHRETTLTMDKMAKQGICFKNAIAPGPRTLPSMPQIFTGKLMNFLVTEPKGDLGAIEDTRRHLRLNKTLVEILSSKGYTTMGFTPNAYTSSYCGFNKGFHHFQDFFKGGVYRGIFNRFIEGRKIFSHLRNFMNLMLKQEVFKCWESYYEEIINCVKRTKEPFFLWILLLDTHLPWLVPKKFKRWGKYFDMYHCNWKLFKIRSVHNPSISEKVKRKLIDAYDDSIYYADLFINQLKIDLEDYDPIFVIHSDHGENFGERGFYAHFYPLLYEENIHVPLVIGNVDQKMEIEEPISLLNLPKIILDLCANNSFSPNKNDDWIIAKDFDYENKRDVIALRIKNWKFITGIRGDELYNLEKDPNERENLIDNYPDLAKEMKKIIKAHIRDEIERRKIHIKISKIKSRVSKSCGWGGWNG